MGLCEGEMRSSSRVLRTVPGTHSKLSVNGGQATVSIPTILLPFLSYVEDVSSSVLYPTHLQLLDWRCGLTCISSDS